MLRRSMATVWLAVLLAAPLVHSTTVRADGCYACGAGSSPACGGFCRYTGNDSFGARKQCENKGCRVTGPTACPASGAQCKAPTGSRTDAASAAQIAWCPAALGAGSS